MPEEQATNEDRGWLCRALDRFRAVVPEAMWRVTGTVVGALVFGLLAYLMLDGEIRVLLLLFPGLLDSDPLVKGLLLTGLLFLVLVLVFIGVERASKKCCPKWVERSGPVFDWLTRWLDDWFRNLDWCLNRSIRDDSFWGRLLGLPGHSWKPSLFAVLLAWFIALGPRLPPVVDGVYSYALFLLALLGILVVNWCQPARFQFLPHLLVLVILGLAVFFWPGADTQRVVDAGPYRHFIIPAFGAIGIALAVAYFFSWLIFGKYAGRLAPAVGGTDAASTGGEASNQDPGESAPAAPAEQTPLPVDCKGKLVLKVPDRSGALGIEWKRFGRSLMKAPVFHFVEIAWWPSLAVVFVADTDTMAVSAFVLLVAAWVVYAFAEMHDELESFLGGLKRSFFIGGQFAVSVIIVLLAAGRSLDNGYVTTLIEGEGFIGGMNDWLLLYYVASAYTFFWYFEYWINRFSAERFLAMLQRNGDGGPIAGPIDTEYKEGNVKAPGALSVHAAARYALMRKGGGTAGERCVKRILGRMKLVKEVIDDEREVNVSSRAKGAVRETLPGREFKLVLLHRSRFYFVTIYLALAGATGGVGWTLYSLPQRAAVSVKLPAPGSPMLFNLREHLFSQKRREGRPAILLAASGGGTRASVYTYAVLRGLHDIGALDDVVLASGVSGGSAAIAYFAMHRAELIKDPRSPPGEAAPCKGRAADCEGWTRFGEVMGAPFIQDALRGVSEWRMAGGCLVKRGGAREGMRLGILLQESFDQWYTLDAKKGRVFSAGCAGPVPWPNSEAAVTRLGDQKAVGLIFNTTLAGTFEEDPFACPADETCEPLSVAERRALDGDGGYRTTTRGKGGRLVLTNLKVERLDRLGVQAMFPSEADALAEAPGDYLSYEVVYAPEIPLVSAAALSANFPPVFPNAAVDVADAKGRRSRYWVTDGGAAENRGIVSLLYALEAALREEHWCAHGGEASSSADCEGDACAAERPPRRAICGRRNDVTYPAIHIVLAEASATVSAYSQDRGISTAFGAAERFASQLLVDKLKTVRELYGRLEGEGIYLHKLAMPLTLRSAGGIGTHWMLPEKVTLRRPFGAPTGCAEGVEGADACWPELPDDVERFRRRTEPGVNIEGRQAKRLVEVLHRVPWQASTLPDVCAVGEKSDQQVCNYIQKVWHRWICKDPQQPAHPAGWYCLVKGLDREGNAYANQTYASAGCEIPAISCADARLNR